MATVLLATEADEGMGHVAPWVGFVARAVGQGLRVHWAVPRLALLQGLAGLPPGVGVWQAPLLRNTALPGIAAPKSWPELLVSLGYADAAQLTGAVRAWVSMLEQLKPDVVLADYAPALMAAARITGRPCLEVGSGFCVPPLLPAPCHFPGVRVAGREALDQADTALVAAFNAALRFCGSEELLASLGDMAGWPARRVVLSPPALDHYGPRTDVLYAGFLGGAAGMSRATAPELRQASASPAVRVLGYLKPDTPGLSSLIAQLRDAGVTAHLVVPGRNASERDGEGDEGADEEGDEGGDGGECLERQGRVTVSGRWVDMPQALRQADVYLSNGGLHGIGLALQAGCWPVVAPMQAEQVAMARNLVVQRQGALWLQGQPWPAVPSAFDRPKPWARDTAGGEALLLDLVAALA